MPTRLEKSIARERHILDSAWQLVANEGFLALKISELAKIAGVSIGTLYVHFESKEDLIIAMAMDAWKDMEQVLIQALEGEASPVRRLMAFSIMGHRYNIAHPVRFEANQLAGVPSIWQRASLRHHQQVPEGCEAFEGRLKPVIRDAIESGELEKEENLDHQIDAFSHGLWAVGIGNAYINYVITPEALREPHDERLERDVRRHIIALFKGYGWAVNNPHAVYDEVSAHCARLALRNSD